MAKIKKIWAQILIQKKLYLIFGLMAILIIFELLILKYAMTNLSAVRAFVYGESVWSKAQKDSAYFLKRMAITKNEKDFEAYKESLFVPHECRLARLELYKKNPDMDLVRRGFINGKIHSDEVGPILHMIQNFSWLNHIAQALETWRVADELLQDFEVVAEKYHRAVMNPESDPELIRKYSLRLHDLNLKLGKAEDRFSFALQEGARWLENVVLISLLSLVVIVEVTGFLLVFFFGRSLSKGLKDLIEASRRIANRVFTEPLPVTSQDEVGQLTQSINQMGQTIQESHQGLERKIAEAIKTRDEFYSIATHELKTPVTAIQLSLQMLQKKLKSETEEINREKLSEQVNKCIVLSRKLTGLQDTLMDVTRISSGIFEIKISEHDLMDVIRHSIDEATVSEVDRTVTLEGPDHLHSSFDPVRIGQVVSNLVKNALKYGDNKPVHVQVKDSQDRIEINVLDRGHGISLDHQEKIFEQFIRVNADAGISGLGMGLYISRKIMEGHGGTLGIAASSDKGTTFSAILPKKKV